MDNVRQQVQNALHENKLQAISGRLGVVMSYDRHDNTATVVISGEQTDEIEDVLTKVMCPVTLGVQSVAPSPGMQCWVIFKGGNMSQPLITHFFNHKYGDYDYPRQTPANNSIPSYLLGL